MAIDIDEIKKQVASKNDVLVSNDDPVLVVATMTEVLLRQCVETLNTQQEENLRQLLEALRKGNIEAKETAGVVITEAADYVSEQVHIGATAALEEAKSQINELRDEVVSSRKSTVIAAGVSFVCAVVAVGAAIIG